MPRKSQHSIADDIKQTKERVQAVRELMRAMAKTAKAFHLYGTEHQLTSKFLGDLQQAVTTALSMCGRIDLEVTDSELLYGDEIVYEKQGQEGNLAFSLFKDGIRRLSIVEQPSSQELNRFLNILGMSPQAMEKRQEDMVSLLWKAELEAFQYAAIDGFAEMLAGDMEFARKYDELLESLVPTYAQLAAGEESDEEDDWGQAMFRQEPPDAPLPHGLVERVSQRLSGLVSAQPALNRMALTARDEDDDALFEHVASILLQAVLREDSAIHPADAVRYFRMLVEGMAGNHALGALITTLETLEVLYQRPQLLNGDLAIALKILVSDLSSVNYLRTLLPYLSVAREDQLVSLGRFFLRNGIGDYTDETYRLLDLDIPEAARDMLSAILEAASAGHQADWRRWLEGDDPDKAMEALKAAAEHLEPAQAHPYLMKGLEHDDPDVRIEAARFLLDMDQEAYRDTVLQLMDDPDPGVRTEILGMLQRFSLAEVGPHITRKIRSRGFRRLDYDEQAAWIKALARPGQGKYVSVLEDLMDFPEHTGLKSLFSKKAMDLTPTRQAVLDALFQIGTKEAEAVIRRAQDEGDREFRSYCRNFDLMRRHRELLKAKEKGDRERSLTGRSKTEQEKKLRLTPIVPLDPEDPNLELLVAMEVIEKMAPEEPRFLTLDDVPDELEQKAETRKLTHRPPLLEGLERDQKLRELILDMDRDTFVEVDDWVVHPVAAMVYLAPRGRDFELPQAVATARSFTLSDLREFERQKSQPMISIARQDEGPDQGSDEPATGEAHGGQAPGEAEDQARRFNVRVTGSTMVVGPPPKPVRDGPSPVARQADAMAQARLEKLGSGEPGGGLPAPMPTPAERGATWPATSRSNLPPVHVEMDEPARDEGPGVLVFGPGDMAESPPRQEPSPGPGGLEAANAARARPEPSSPKTRTGVRGPGAKVGAGEVAPRGPAETGARSASAAGEGAAGGRGKAVEALLAEYLEAMERPKPTPASPGRTRTGRLSTKGRSPEQIVDMLKEYLGVDPGDRS